MKRLEEYLEKTNTKFISIDLSDKRRIIVESKYGQHSIFKSSLARCNTPTIETAVDKTLFFKNRATEIHGDLYDYSKSKYTICSNNLIITCRIHGDFIQTPTTHLKGSGCPVCNPFYNPISQDDFVRRLKLISPELTVLSNINGNRGYVNVSDKLGIVYNMNVGSLLKGTMPTIRIAVDRNLAFEIKSRSVHGDKYIYSKSNYVTGNTKVIINCPKHGDFTQRPMPHLMGAGCPRCGDISTRQYNSENPSGWNISSWSNSASLSKNFTGFKVYIIRCHLGAEEFIKIGRTYVDISRRYMNKERMPYNYEVIKVITGSAAHMFKLESKLKRICKDFKHLVGIEFCGMHECFDIKSLELIKNYL